MRSAKLRRNIQTPRGCPVTYTAKKETTIAVGHQSGKDLHDEVYLSVYSVSGTDGPHLAFPKLR